MSKLLNIDEAAAAEQTIAIIDKPCKNIVAKRDWKPTRLFKSDWLCYSNGSIGRGNTEKYVVQVGVELG